MEAAPAGESAGIEAAVVGAARVAEDDGSGARMEAAPVGAVRAAEAGGSERATANNNEAAVSAADDGSVGNGRQHLLRVTRIFFLSRCTIPGCEREATTKPSLAGPSTTSSPILLAPPLPLIPSSLSSALKRARRQGDRN